jgi:RNA polymerase sigma-70 factor (ECF subfamily)
MERILRRDDSALEMLYDRYGRPVYALVLRISRQPASAEEIVQDVFLQVWRNADRYQNSRGPLGPWLFTVARNRALDFLRLKQEKQRRRERRHGSISTRREGAIGDAFPPGNAAPRD